MKSRIAILKVAPRAVQAMMGLQNYVNSTVEHQLLHLVKMRASQINGCAYCLDMHSKEARKAGETDGRPVLSIMRVLNPDKLYRLGPEFDSGSRA
jgi:AhpD family alkylhydroperoxidase